MVALEHDELRVVVPVGFLLAEPQEVTVSVNRPGGAPLPIRLRLIPARPREEGVGAAPEPAPGSAPAQLAIHRPGRAKTDPDDGYTEYGGGD